MKEILRLKMVPAFLLVVLSATLLMAGLGKVPLARSTEPRVLGIATQMYLDANYVLPQLNGSPFLEKPPLQAWLSTGAFHVFGLSILSSRVISVVAAVAILVLIMGFLRRQGYPVPVPFLAAVCLLTMADYWGHGRMVCQDVLLTLGVTLALLSTYNYSVSPKWYLLLSAALGVAIASLSKGIIGIAIMAGVAGGYLLLKALLIDKSYPVKVWAALLAAFFAGLVPLAIWLWVLYRKEGWDAFYEITWVNSVGRFLGKFEGTGHQRPWYYYLVRLPLLFQPWLLLVGLGVYRSFKRLRVSSLDLFYLCWLIIPFVMLSLSSGKRMVYLLVLYPVAALLTGRVLSVYLEEKSPDAPELTKAEKTILIIQGIIISVASVGCFVLPFLHRASVVWLVLPIAAVALMVFAWRACRRGNIRMFLGSGFAVSVLLFLFYGGAFDGRLTKGTTLENIFREGASGDAPVVLYRPTEVLSGAAVFFLRHTVPEITTPQEGMAFLKGDQSAFIVSSKKELRLFDANTQKVMANGDDFYVLRYRGNSDH